MKMWPRNLAEACGSCGSTIAKSLKTLVAEPRGSCGSTIAKSLIYMRKRKRNQSPPKGELSQRLQLPRREMLA